MSPPTLYLPETPRAQHAKTAGAARRRRELFADAVAIIEEEFGTQLTLTGVARRIGASTRNLQRAFAEAAGTSFSRCLREVRMQRAAEMLEASGVPVKAVANAVGYRQQAEFARQFRARFGHSPTYGALGGVVVFLVWLWLTNVAILLGAELDAERERSQELKEGVPGAEREIQLEHRSDPKDKKKTRTA